MNQKTYNIVLILLIVFSFFSAIQPTTKSDYDPQGTYYVSTTGSDITGDGSIGNPWGTIDYAYEHINGQFVLNIRNGTYDERVYQYADRGKSGTIANPSIIQAYPGEVVYWMQRNTTGSPNGAFDATQIQNLTIQNINFVDCVYFGIHLLLQISTYPLNNITIYNCTFTNISCSAIKVRGANAPAYSILIDACSTYNIENGWSSVGHDQEGISFSDTHLSRINNTRMRLCYKNNIDIKGDSSRNVVSNCTINTSRLHYTGTGTLPIGSGGGVYFDAYGQSTSWNIVENCHIFGNRTSIHFNSEVDDGNNAGCNNNTAINCILHVNESPQVDVFPVSYDAGASGRAQLRFNSVYYCTLIGGFSCVGLYRAAADIISCNITDCIMTDADNWAIQMQEPVGNYNFSAYNNLFNLTSEYYGHNSVNGTPDFKGTGSDPYNITSTSDAIDAGADCGYYIDYAFTIRPQGLSFDIGAYEFAEESESTIEFVSIDGGTNGTSILSSCPTFNWTLVANTTQYWLQISTTSTFITLTANITNVCEVIFPTYYTSNATHVSFTLPPSYSLAPNTYYCRVCAQTRSGL